jgi:hypothetical protein
LFDNSPESAVPQGVTETLGYEVAEKEQDSYPLLFYPKTKFEYIEASERQYQCEQHFLVKEFVPSFAIRWMLCRRLLKT